MEQTPADQPMRWKQRIGILAVGHTFKRAEELVFDFTLYPLVIALLGAIVGGLIMTAFSALVCYLYILFYDWSKRDWLGLELLRELRDGEEKQGRVARLMQRAARKGNWLAFLALSCYTDPFVTTVYLRKSAETYNGLSARDWRVFWASVLVANLWWTVLVTSGVAGVRLLLSWLRFS